MPSFSVTPYQSRERTTGLDSAGSAPGTHRIDLLRSYPMNTYCTFNRSARSGEKAASSSAVAATGSKRTRVAVASVCLMVTPL